MESAVPPQERKGNWMSATSAILLLLLLLLLTGVKIRFYIETWDLELSKSKPE
jgi:hypothetical protein